MSERYRSHRIRLRSYEPRMSNDEIREVLCEGEIQEGALVPWGSNYTYYVTLEHEGRKHRAVYKPRAGEAPLIDFPSGTLYLREYAASLVNDWLGWSLVPPTVVRNGPYGVGSVQAYVEARGAPHVYALGPQHREELQCLVLFDLITNNADRKPAHVFPRFDGGICAIDHGLTFHARPKLRTVIWDFCGEPIPTDLLESLERAARDRRSDIHGPLSSLLSGREVDAFWKRIASVLQSRKYPVLDPRYNIPYGFA